MKNLLPICLILNALGSFAYSAHAEPLVQLDNERVQLLLKSYAEIVSFYQDQIDDDSLKFLAAKTAEVEAQLNAQLTASEDRAVTLITQNFTLRFPQ